MRRLALLALLACGACEPSAPVLDGGPASESPAPGELAGGPPIRDLLLPGVLNLAPPPGANVMLDCEKIVAPDYDNPPAMACIFFEADAQAAAETDPVAPAYLAAMRSAGWDMARAQGAQRYFQRARAGTDCADVAVFTVLDGDALARLTNAARAPAPPPGRHWNAYAIPVSTHEACGADRIK